MTVEQKEQLQEEKKADLLTGVQEQAEEEKPEEKMEEEKPSESAVVINPEQIAAIQDLAVDGAVPIAQAREDAEFLLKHIDVVDASQFQKGGLYENLDPLQMNGKLIYQMSQEEIDRNIAIIEESDLSPQDKRQRVRLIDKAMIQFNHRKDYLHNKLTENLKDANLREWQQVELSFKDKEKGIPGIEKHIKDIWDFCVEQMEASPSLKAKCTQSISEKVKLTARAIKELDISQKLSGDDSENERPNVGIPAGNAGKQPSNRGSKEPTFTRAQLQELSRKGNITPEVLAQINKANAEGRIKQ